MFKATIQKLGETTVLGCEGRFVIGDAYAILRSAVLRTDARTIILDLARVDRMDAGGLGVLLGLREWAGSNAIRLLLMNVMHQVELVLELTELDRVFEFCSVCDMFRLLHPASAMELEAFDQTNPLMLEDSGDCPVDGQDTGSDSATDGVLAAIAVREPDWGEWSRGA